MNKIKLGDICTIRKGTKVEQIEQKVDSIRFIQIDDLRNDNRIKYCDANKKYVVANANDIIIAWDGANAGTIGFGLDGAIGSTLAMIRLNNNNLATKFVGLLLRGNFEYLRNNCTGATIPHINRTSLEDISVPLFPLETQKQIVKTLDTAAELLAMRKQQLAELDCLIKSTFYDMFGDPVTNEKGWEAIAVDKVTDCIVPGRDKPKSFTGDMPWITTSDLIIGGYTKKSSANIGLSKSEINNVRAKIIPKNSVIMCCVGDIGVTSIAGNDLVMNQQLHSFQCGERINEIFLCIMLPYYKNQMIKLATSTTVLYMNKTSCNSIEVILPPLSLQTKFAEIVTKIEEQKALVKKAIEETQYLFDSLMSEYFE